MSSENWSKMSGKILGQIIGVWFAFTVATLMLIFPIKCTVWLVSKIWGLW